METKQKFNNYVSSAMENIRSSSSEKNSITYNRMDFNKYDNVDSITWIGTYPEYPQGWVSDFQPNQPSNDNVWVSKPSTGGWELQRGQITVIPTTSTGVSIGPVEQIDVSKLARDLEGFQKRLDKVEEKPNKVDQDLIKGKFPYNIKVDFKGDIYYSFACAGYQKEQIQLKLQKEGLQLSFSERKEDDYIEEEFEYICKGIKQGNEKVSIYVDFSKYNPNKIFSKLENGILTIKIEKNDISLGIEDLNLKESVEIIDTL